MPVLATSPTTVFYEVPFRLEAELEELVVRYADAIFGPTSIYLDIKKRIGKSVLSVPDAYVIDMADPDRPQLFVIENEIEAHDAFNHIGIQMLRFVTSFEQARKKLRDVLMTEMLSNDHARKRLEAGFKESSKRNIDNYLDEAVYAPFRGVVIIDHAGPELHSVLNHINADFNVLELRRYATDSGSVIHLFDTLYDDDEAPNFSQTKAKTVSEIRDRRKHRASRRAKSDTIIVPAKEDGFEQVFIEKECWYAIRIGAAMRPRLKYIAAYQTRPISAITHVAEIDRIEPYEDTGKFIIYFKGPAKQFQSVGIDDPNKSPQAPVYAKYDDLLKADTLDQLLN